MTLISILLALLIERLGVRSRPWQAATYLSAMVPWQQRLPAWLWLISPALLVALLMTVVDFWLLELLLGTVLLLVCLGCWHYRQLYKQYLNASSRQDFVAADLVAQQMQHDMAMPNGLSMGQQLVWINFRYYAAVLFWFALGGAIGAVLYATLRFATEAPSNANVAGETNLAAGENLDAGAKVAAADGGAATAERGNQQPSHVALVQLAQGAIRVLDWLPLRLFGFGFALVGHFSRTRDIWQQGLLDSQQEPALYLGRMACAAEADAHHPQYHSPSERSAANQPPATSGGAFSAAVVNTADLDTVDLDNADLDTADLDTAERSIASETDAALRNPAESTASSAQAVPHMDQVQAMLLLQLAKRNNLFFLALVALLTISGTLS
jgi:AmpE protein